MIMPFADAVATQAYTHCIKPVCDNRGLTVRRADELFTTNPVWQDIVDEIHRASVIVVDITGKNPNVLYELGMAHLLKPAQTIMITRDAHDDAPFDISHFRIIRYVDNIEGVKRFEEEFGKTLDFILQDLTLLYREEFTMVADVSVACGQTAHLGALIGLKNSTRSIRYRERLDIGLAYPDRDRQRKQETFHTCASVRDVAETLYKLRYVDLVGEQITVTDKGRALAAFLEDAGWVCHQLNDQIFTPGYVNPFDAAKGATAHGPSPG